MGFRQNSYHTVWSVEPGRTGNTMTVRISSSRKSRDTGEYVQDFSGYCMFIGKANQKARSLRKMDRIKLLECDVTTNYDKERKREYVNYKVFDFEMADGSSTRNSNTSQNTSKTRPKTAFEVDSGEAEPEEDSLPF